MGMYRLVPLTPTPLPRRGEALRGIGMRYPLLANVEEGARG